MGERIINDSNELKTGEFNLKVVIYDSTLRDEVQAQGISFTVEDKLRIVNGLTG